MKQESTEERSNPSTTGYVTRPGVVTFICITSFIGIVVYGLFLMPVAVGQYQPGDQEFVLTIAIFVVILGMYLAIILGLWHAKNWARIAYVVVFPLLTILGILGNFEVLGNPDISEEDLNISIFYLVRSVPELIFLAIFCVLLYRPKSSAYFSGMVLPPIDPATGLEGSAREVIRCPSCGKETYSTASSCHHCGTDLKLTNTAT